MVNYYQILGLEFGASVEQVRRAYREYVKHFHPDKHQNSEFFKERFQELQHAYGVLSDESARRKYDNVFSNNSNYLIEDIRKELVEEKLKSSDLAEQLAALDSQLNNLKYDYETLLRKKQARRNNKTVTKEVGAGWRYAFLFLLSVDLGVFVYKSQNLLKADNSSIIQVATPTVTPKTVNPKTFPETFELTTKDSGQMAIVGLDTGLWLFNEACIGRSIDDHKLGNQAARLYVSGRLTMQFDAPTGVRRINIQSATYGNDGPSIWELWLSRDHGRTWQRSGQPQTTSNTTLQQSTFVGVANEPIRLEIRKTDASNNRLNIDGVNIEADTGPVTAVAL